MSKGRAANHLTNLKISIQHGLLKKTFLRSPWDTKILNKMARVPKLMTSLTSKVGFLARHI